jgi:hypothetical protein
MASFADLIVPQTQAQLEASILVVLQELRFPVTSWDASSVPKRLIKAFAKLMADVWLLVAYLALGSYLETSTGAWLTFLARNFYGITRAAATYTIGIVRIQNDSGAGLAIAVGQYLVRAGALYYRNTDTDGAGGTGGATLADGDFLDLTFKAATAGAAYNVANEAITAFTIDVPGVTVSNPAVGVTGTWITTAGSDEQDDTSLKLACSGRWETLGTGSPATAYVTWAVIAAPTITRTRPLDDEPQGPNTVELLLANSAGGASAGELADVEAYVEEKVPEGAGLTYTAAANNEITVTGTARASSAYLAAAQAAVVANFVRLAAETDIGGGTEGAVRGAQILEEIMSAPGVRNFTPFPADEALAFNEVPTFTLDITWQEI